VPRGGPDGLNSQPHSEQTQRVKNPPWIGTIRRAIRHYKLSRPLRVRCRTNLAESSNATLPVNAKNNTRGGGWYFASEGMCHGNRIFVRKRTDTAFRTM
jgi:hypothetical protein